MSLTSIVRRTPQFLAVLYLYHTRKAITLELDIRKYFIFYTQVCGDQAFT